MSFLDRLEEEFNRYEVKKLGEVPFPLSLSDICFLLDRSVMLDKDRKRIENQIRIRIKDLIARRSK